MLRVNIDSMSDMELAEHITVFIEKRDKRQQKAKEYVWKAVVDAIKNYCDNFGSITVSDYDQSIDILPFRMDFSSLGEIECKESY